MGTISRRTFLQQLAACSCGVAAWGSLGGFDIPRAHAATGNGKKLLIVNMNGGWDGLYILQPSRGALLSTLSGMRPTLFQPPQSLLPAGTDYGFHHSLGTLKSLFDEGSLLPILSVGYENMSRSHEDAEVAFARGVRDRFSAASSGFINRLGAAYGWHSLQAVSVSGTDRAFEGGEYRGIQVQGLDGYRFTGDGSVSHQENLHRRDMLYASASGWGAAAPGSGAASVLGGIDLVSNTTNSIRDAISAATFVNQYPSSYFGRSFRDVEILLSTPQLGTEVAYMRRVGFDSHSQQAATIDGMLAEFSTALQIFVANMKGRGLWSNLIVLVISEFGRTNRENGSLGTDHGGAVPAFLLGGPVRGGQIVGDISPTELTGHGWLPMHYHIADVYRSVVTQLGYDPDRVFEQTGGAALPSLFL